MFALDLSTIILVSANVLQMISILFILLPFVDIVTISKKLKLYVEKVKRNRLLLWICGIYLISIITLGILEPMRTLQASRIPRSSLRNETPQQKLIRVINTTNATRNYLLAGFSLFYILVAWRLYEYVIFSAKLHEFSNLIGSYELIDITFIAEPESEKVTRENSFIIEESSEESVHWPSVANLNRTEHKKIRTFLKEKKDNVDNDKASFPKKADKATAVKTTDAESAESDKSNDGDVSAIKENKNPGL